MKQLSFNSYLFFSFRLGVATLISFVLGSLLGDWTKIPESKVIGGLWAVISSLLVMKHEKEEAFIIGLERILGTFIGSVVSIFCIFVSDNILITVPLAVFLSALISFIMGFDRMYTQSTVTVCVIILVWEISSKQNLWVFSASRFFESAIGVIVGLVINHHFIRPKWLKNRLEHDEK